MLRIVVYTAKHGHGILSWNSINIVIDIVIDTLLLYLSDCVGVTDAAVTDTVTVCAT